MTAYCDGLLRICGFDDDEIAEQGPRIEEVCRKIGIGPQDMDRVEGRVKSRLDIEMIGVKKLLRAWILELSDLILAKDEGKTIVYYSYPSIQGPGMAIKASSNGNLYIGCPDAIVGGIILGIAESITGGYIAIEFKNTIAFLTIIVVLLIKLEDLLGKEFRERV